ncbi:MAG: 16S rRNA (cytosine(967)-C(5))-methyltransferase RsmB [Planctomycetota bacterium]
MRNARSAAVRALLRFEQGRTGFLSEDLDRPDIEERDRPLAREIAYGVLRRRRLLDHLIGGLSRKGLPSDPLLLSVLRVGVYQLLYCPSIPARAAVHSTVSLLGAERRSFPNALLRRIAGMIEGRAADPSNPRREIPLGEDRTLDLGDLAFRRDRPALDPGILGVLHSLPDFLVRRWVERHGARAEGILAAAGARPAIFLRNRAGLCSPKELRLRLEGEGVSVAPARHPRVLRWEGGASPFGTSCFRDGWFVAQDPTAVEAAEALRVRPGERVLDLCAAPGTKATLLAEATGPGGVVHAHDVRARRLDLVRANAERLSLPWLKIAENPDEAGLVDAVLVDAPCSNTGVLARRAEARWRIEETTFSDMARVQRELLADAMRRVVPGGRVLYSTCSIEPEEDEQVVRSVLGGEWTLAAERLILPLARECDGGYFALLEHRGFAPSDLPPAKIVT